MRGRAVELMMSRRNERRRILESSKGDRDGNEGISLSSTASIRLHIREGVSSIVVMINL